MIINKNSKEQTLTPTEYFEELKKKKETVNDEVLTKYYNSALRLINKYKVTEQQLGLKKLIFHVETITKERELVKLGINTFIYQDDVDEFIDNVDSRAVKIIELRNYEREVPDEIVEVVQKTKHLFNEFYVLFTDYTGKVEKRVEKERREKDPILFGVFQDEKTKSINERFYYLGDWEDEYCDLTLDKMLAITKEKTGKDIAFTISTPEDIDELKQQLAALDEENRMRQELLRRPVKKSFFQNIRSVFSGK